MLLVVIDREHCHKHRQYFENRVIFTQNIFPNNIVKYHLPNNPKPQKIVPPKVNKLE